MIPTNPEFTARLTAALAACPDPLPKETAKDVMRVLLLLEATANAQRYLEVPMLVHCVGRGEENN